MIFFM